MLPSVHWQGSFHRNERFPFRLYASALRGTGPDAEEVLAIAVTCRYRENDGAGRFIVSADILDGNGAVLATSPIYEVPIPTEAMLLDRPEESLGNVTRQLQAVMRRIDQWLRAKASVIQATLVGRD